MAVKSTVPPGTADELAAAFPRLIFVSVPEFLVATRAMETFTRPDRILIGSCSHLQTSRSRRGRSHVPSRSCRSCRLPAAYQAELAKLCSDAMVAAKVAMARELAEVCGRTGVEWSRVQSVVGLDRRIGPDQLTVTQERGFGGACFPKDLDGLIAASRQQGYRPRLLEGLAEFNTNR